MKKTLIISTNIGSLFLLATVTHAWDALTAFLIAGIVPGTTYSLPPLAMLACISIVAGGLVLLGNRILAAHEPSERTTPRRRYGRL